MSKDSNPEVEVEEEQGYKGPMTRAKARALQQADALIVHYFGT